MHYQEAEETDHLEASSSSIDKSEPQVDKSASHISIETLHVDNDSIPTDANINESRENNEQRHYIAEVGVSDQNVNNQTLPEESSDPMPNSPRPVVKQSELEPNTTGPNHETTAPVTRTSDTTADYVTTPDFGSQLYYNWLSSFTELCKVVPMPLDMSLFHKISQVHKTLSDVMATPSGVVADKENFKILMNISRELNTIINEHLMYVMQNLQENN